MQGPGGGSLSTWRDKKEDDISKKDDEQFHPWLVENKAKKDNMAKKEDADLASKLEMPGPGEKGSSGAKSS